MLDYYVTVEGDSTPVHVRELLADEGITPAARKKLAGLKPGQSVDIGLGGAWGSFIVTRQGTGRALRKNPVTKLDYYIGQLYSLSDEMIDESREMDDPDEALLLRQMGTAIWQTQRHYNELREKLHEKREKAALRAAKKRR